MRNKRLLTYLLVVSLASILLIGCETDDVVIDQAEPAESIDLLYVQLAESGTFVSGASPDTYTFTLNNVWSDTLYFADRPSRVTGIMSTESFVEMSSLFNPENPPNAAIVLSDPRFGDQDVVIGVLTNPQYNAAQKTLSYDIKVLDKPESPDLSQWEAELDATLPASFGTVSVFIDSEPVLWGLVGLRGVGLLN